MRTQHHFCEVIPKTHKLKVSGKPKLRNILQNNQPVLFKSVIKGKARIKELPQNREHKETNMANNAMCDPGLNSGPESNWQNPNKICKYASSIEFILISATQIVF